VPGPGDLPQELPALPEGVLRLRLGSGANCSSAGSAIDILFYGSVLAGALAVALAAALPPARPSGPKVEPDPPGPAEGADSSDALPGKSAVGDPLSGPGS